jgi:hypothetical protein
MLLFRWTPPRTHDFGSWRGRVERKAKYASAVCTIKTLCAEMARHPALAPGAEVVMKKWRDEPGTELAADVPTKGQAPRFTNDLSPEDKP